MTRVIDFSKKVAALAAEYDDFTEIMKELGFREITAPTALKLMGKVMTVPKGAAVKGIPLERVVEAFEKKGYRVVGLPDGFRRPLESVDKEDKKSKIIGAREEEDEYMRRLREAE